MDADRTVAHVALKLRPGRQSRDGVDHDEVHRAGPHERIHDLERLFAGIGLGNQKLVEIDAQLLGVLRIERMFGVDEGADAPLLLLLGHDMQGQRRLARAFGPVDFHDPALRQTADSQRDVEPQRAGRGRFDIGQRVVTAQLHDRSLAELAFDLRQRRIKGLLLVRRLLAAHAQEICRCHLCHPYFIPARERQLLLCSPLVLHLVAAKKRTFQDKSDLSTFGQIG